MSTPRDIVVLVGSLRKESFNRKTAKALIAIAPPALKLEIVEIGQLPLYNEDRRRCSRRANGPISASVCTARKAFSSSRPNTTARCRAC